MKTNNETLDNHMDANNETLDKLVKYYKSAKRMKRFHKIAKYFTGASTLGAIGCMASGGIATVALIIMGALFTYAIYGDEQNKRKEEEYYSDRIRQKRESTQSISN